MSEDASAGGVLREPVSDAGTSDANAQMWNGGGRRGRRGRHGKGRSDDGGREQSMVPRAEFRSYYGRPVLKPPVWKGDIAGYLFAGGLSAGSALLAAGGDLTGRPALRRGGRLGALATIGASTYLLIHDLGRPDRFYNMLRVAKPTSPMSVGTWLLAAYGPGVGIAAASELMPPRVRRTALGRLVDASARPAGIASALVAPGVASYTAVLLSQTAVPAWHEAHVELPFVFTGSAAASSGGLGMIVAPTAQAGPARRFALFGAALELAASQRMEGRLGLVAEAYHHGEAGRRLRMAKALTAAGALGTLLAGRSRLVAAASGAALLAGSGFLRFGVFAAGVASTKDPKYVVQPQRERVERHGPTRVTS